MPHVNVGREYLVSTDTILNLLCVAVLIAFAVTAWLLTRDEKPTEEERAGLTVWDSAAEKWIRLAPGAERGPGQMTSREVEDADQLELLWLAPAFDPETAAGWSRLQQAIDDDHTNQGEA